MSDSNKSEADKDLEVFAPQGVDVTVGGEKFNVQPFMLGNRLKVISILAKIFMECAKLPGFRDLDNAGAIASIMQVAGDRLADIYVVVLKKEKEWLETHMTLKDEVMVIDAIMQVNDLPFLVRQIQGMIASHSKKS